MKNQLTKEDFSSMTVNERLFVSGLLDDFDKAVAQQNKAKLRLILEKINLSPDNIEAIIEQVLR